MRAKRREPSDGERGAAYVEFLIAFIPLFIMFLGMVQMSLMYAGDLVVQHAASRAARAAVVVLDDDPRYYDGAERRTVSSSGFSSSEEGLSAILSLFGAGSGGGGSGPGASGGPRLSAIRRAASLPLSSISPSLDQLIDSDSVMTAIGSPETRAATGVFMYNNSAMGVSFPSSPGGSDYRETFNHGQQVTTRVTYLFHCGVPVASRLMCDTYPTIRLGPAAAMIEDIIRDAGDGSLSWDDARERLRRIDESRARHERDSEAVGELETAGASDLMYLTWATGSRFKVMRGEATMPLQSAHYEYR
ncbi:MAG: pilus assembly protein [Myxococcales bacterium]|nr:pilus assembly protein [Myxococcales bacterium]